MFMDREPCPVCGHPTGDCAGDGAEPLHVIGPGIFPSLGHEETIIATKDIFEDRQIAPDVTARVLVVRAGTPMKASLAKKYGIL